MRVLMITGDKSFGPGHPRYELQKSAVDDLAVVYWGRSALWPAVPPGPFDVVTAQDPLWRGLFAWRAARMRGAKLNVQVHTDLKSLARPSLRSAWFVLRRAHSVRAVSERIKKQVLAIAPHARVTVLPVYVDVAKFAAVERRAHSAKNVLWMGRFEEEKNPLAALEVIAEVAKTVPGARLTMLGQGSMEEAVKARAKDAPGVEVLGWQEPAPHLSVADVVLCTSWHESWGASIVEALAAGVPVVAPDVGVAREAGAVVAPRAELAQAVKEVLAAGLRGTLQLQLLDARAWAQAWRESLG